MTFNFGRALGAKLGLEDAELIGDEVDTVEVPDAPEETVEAAETEQVEAEAEVEADEDTAGDLDESIQTLDGVEQGLEAAMLRGGVTPGEAYAYQVAIKAAMRPFGFGDSVVATLEDAGTDGNSKKEATSSTLGNVKAAILKWWEAFKAQMAKLWVSIKRWVASIFDTTAKLKERAVAIVKKATETKGTAKESTLKLNMFTSLFMRSAPPRAADLVTGLAAINKMVDKSIGVKTSADFDELVKTAPDAINDPQALEGNGALLAEHGESVAGMYGATKVGDVKKYGSEGQTVKVSDPMLGDRMVVVAYLTKPKSDDGKYLDLMTLLRGFSANIVNAGTEKKEGAEYTFETLTLEQIKTVGGSVISICDQLLASKELWAKRDASRNSFDKVINTALDAARKSTGEGSADKVKAIKSIGSALSGLWTKTVKFESATASYASKISSEALNYCNKCLGQYGAGDAKKEEPAKEGEAK